MTVASNSASIKGWAASQPPRIAGSRKPPGKLTLTRADTRENKLTLTGADTREK